LWLEGFGKFKKSNSSGFDPATFPICNIVPQPTSLPRAPRLKYGRRFDY
jgi:hypothetical protein